MKKTIFAIISVFFFVSFNEVKFTYTKSQLDQVVSNINVVYNYIDKSNLPHQDALQLEKILKETGQILDAPVIDSTQNKSK